MIWLEWEVSLYSSDHRSPRYSKSVGNDLQDRFSIISVVQIDVINVEFIFNSKLDLYTYM